MNDHFEFNGMGNNTPNANGGMPPLTPHKPNSWTPIDLFEEGDIGMLMTSMMVELHYKNGKLDRAVLGAGSNEDGTVLRPEHKPTPTIPQMEDRHERQVFTDKAMKWLRRIACLLGGVAITMFAVSLLLRAVVGVY